MPLGYRVWIATAGVASSHLDVRQYEQVTTIEGQEGAFTVYTKDRAGQVRTWHARHVVVGAGNSGGGGGLIPPIS